MAQARRQRNGGYLAGAVLLLAVLGIAASESPETGGDLPDRAAAANAIRSCDTESARSDLGSDDRDSRLLIGLAAFTCQDHALAVELLSLTPDVAHRWEDWRLLALAESAIELGLLESGAQAVDALLDRHLGSPLHPLAYPLGVRFARDAEQLDRALALVRASRKAPLPADLRSDLDVQAWEINQRLESIEALRESARQLLLHSPADAADVDAESAFRSSDGSMPWSDLFSPAEILLRTTNLLAAGMAEVALEMLLFVPEERRDIDWHLLRGRALVDERRGTEALDALVDVTAADRDSAVALEWLRSEAALDAATARRGRHNLPAAEREQMRLLAHGHLWRVVGQGQGSQRAVDALRLLFEEFADGEHFEQVRSILQRLRELSPNDTSGTQYLWQLGWGEYRQRNLSGAIGYWSELADIYPQTRTARSGRYWSARAHEALGNSSRSRTLYDLLASSLSTDYYGKLARERLGLAPQLPDQLSGSADVTWPQHPALDRAESLSNVGLDDLALREIDQLHGVAEPRSEDALRSRILARQGRRRESIQLLWRAFPVLGGAYQDQVPPDALLMYYPLDYLDVVKRFADDNNLGVQLLLAMIRQESAFDIRARSRAGARGLMQVMPATGRELAAKMGLQYSTQRLNDPAFSIQLGSRYFRQVLDMFDGRLELALAGYNAGPYRIRRLVRDAGSDLEIDRFVEDLRFEESKTYVKRIILFSDSYQRLYPDLG